MSFINNTDKVTSDLNSELLKSPVKKSKAVSFAVTTD